MVHLGGGVWVKYRTGDPPKPACGRPHTALRIWVLIGYPLSNHNYGTLVFCVSIFPLICIVFFFRFLAKIVTGCVLALYYRYGRIHQEWYVKWWGVRSELSKSFIVLFPIVCEVVVNDHDCCVTGLF